MFNSMTLMSLYVETGRAPALKKIPSGHGTHGCPFYGLRVTNHDFLYIMAFLHITTRSITSLWLVGCVPALAFVLEKQKLASTDMVISAYIFFFFLFWTLRLDESGLAWLALLSYWGLDTMVE